MYAHIEYLYITLSPGSSHELPLWWGCPNPIKRVCSAMFPASALVRHAVGASNSKEAWDDLDHYFKVKLSNQGFDDPLLWAGIRGDRGQIILMATAHGVLSSDGEKFTRELEWVEALQAAAGTAGGDLGRGPGSEEG